MFTAQLRHTDKIARCRLFIVSGHGPALLGMINTALLDIHKIMCDIMGC